MIRSQNSKAETHGIICYKGYIIGFGPAERIGSPILTPLYGSMWSLFLIRIFFFNFNMLELSKTKI